MPKQICKVVPFGRLFVLLSSVTQYLFWFVSQAFHLVIVSCTDGRTSDRLNLFVVFFNNFYEYYYQSGIPGKSQVLDVPAELQSDKVTLKRTMPNSSGADTTQ